MQKVVERFPIILNNHTVAVIHIFTRHDCIEDMWMSDCYHKTALEIQETGAQQIIDQLEDHFTPAFLMALRTQITKTLKDHDEKYGTKFA